MTYPESFEFALRLVFGQFDLVTWLLALVVFLIALVGVGLFGGLLWNKRWSLFGHLPVAAISLAFALILGVAALNYRSAGRALILIETLRSHIARELTTSGSLNREIFRSAWEKLHPLGGQSDLLPPGEGGQELRLNHEEDARMLAEAAAAAAKRPLLTENPFRLGVPVHVRDPGAVAADVVAAVPKPAYPIIVSPDNEWSRAALGDQATTALDAASKWVRPPMERLLATLPLLAGTLLLFQIAIVAVAACRDIKETPKV